MACMSNNIMLNDASSSNSKMEMSSSSKSSSEQKESSSNESSDNRMMLDRQTSLDKWENGWMFPRRWMLPSLKNEFKDMNLFQSKDSEVIRVKEDDNKMEVRWSVDSLLENILCLMEPNLKMLYPISLLMVF